MTLGLKDAPPALPALSDRRKALSLTTSLAIHIGAFFGLMYAPEIKLPPPSPTEYQQAFAGKEDKLVWYKFDKLPEISPQTKKADKRPLRAANKAAQAIVSSPRNAPKRTQLVLAPAPEIEAPLLESPNLIAVKLPPRAFVTPPDVIKPEQAKIELPENAPELTPRQLDPEKIALERLPGRIFVAPKPAPRPAQAKIDMTPDAPSLTASSLTSTNLPATKLPGRPFEAPASRDQPAARQISVDANAPQLPQALPAGKTIARPFIPPASPAKPNGDTALAAIALSAELDAKDLNAAIIGLNPALTAAKLPSWSTPADFSGGPKVRPDGANADGNSKGIVVSDLFVRGPQPEAKPNLLAQALRPSSISESLRSALRAGEPVMTTTQPSAQAAGAAVKVSSAPDPRFNNRDVYMMAIQMPNLTSAAGSWLMWYAGHDEHVKGLAPIAAPEVHRKVDPKYQQAMVDEHIQGKVQLYCTIGRDGTISAIKVAQGTDARLVRSAEEALAKWEFYPATRNGEPVDVDVLVEIPFLLKPLDVKP